MDSLPPLSAAHCPPHPHPHPQVRRELAPIVGRNKARRDGTSAYAALQQAAAGGGGGARARAGRERLQEAADAIVDMREHDVPYHVRFAIDTGEGGRGGARGGDGTPHNRAWLRSRPSPRTHAPARASSAADVRCGHWFTVRAKGGRVTLERRADLLQRAEPRICAFDIGAPAAGGGGGQGQALRRAACQRPQRLPTQR